MMAAHTGSGLYIPSNIGAPVICAGVAKAVSADGRKVAWVLLLMGRFGDCPYPVAGAVNPTATPTFGLPTATPTVGLPTATPTRTPTQPAGGAGPYRVVLPAVARDSGEAGAGAASSPTVQPTFAVSTPTPTQVLPTPTPGGGAVCGGSATITALDKVNERVTVSGSGNLSGWAIVSTNGGERFEFPAGFVLNGTVVVQSQRVQAMRDGQVWWTQEEVWSNAANDDAQLFDCNGVLIQTFDDGM
jgi:hypothetical protein